MAVEQTQHSAPSQYVQRKKHVPLTLRILSGFFDLLGFLLLAWLIAVAIEWGGMMVIWPEEGSTHSERMLKQELGYLNDDFATSITGSSPALAAFDAAIFVKFYVFEWTHLIHFYDWLKNAPVDASSIRLSIARVAWTVSDYFQALMNTTLIFAVRVTVATLSMPAFLLIGTAALIDGLVQRELRIYGGGIERAMVYHHVKPWIKPAIMSTWFFYLGIPFSIHPNLIFVPAMIVFGMAIFLTSALFKKHL
ncbi:MAG: TIGR03747 family integrating conjugative element membrane protein [Gammaproteobacteria bacterium]|jgi:integrating conjugative element membrane protein (TIGR03747 family)|nr:TIGR03747 family integrating conjugative element membrane protein [Gammaproteobacteria bacterium]MBT3723032.1 TIGR03747 family integrating conjugative element membrane protein [Gammaproteobacteria bacterium]MBT4077965.1 TIGR03747 family integrating conjugative element membrane protein [Gammaproteobacteria bacterium]MBT4195766.1 TIGR03747 family integrating conjugative element membrane protein [Gammaproteobacteria bacterium]MBT4448930.1 TIGR03747 family integrating conjugative element membran